MRRSIEPGDFEAVARFIEQVNARPAARDLHTYDTPADGLARRMCDLADADRLLGLVEERNGQIDGAVLFDIDLEKCRAWLWGPALAPGCDGAALLDQALKQLPVQITRISCFCASENLHFQAILTARNAKFRPVTHVYRALPPVPGETANAVRLGQPADRDALDALHEANFPASYLSADELLARDPAKTHLLVANVGGTLAGYLAATIQSDDTGYIDYLATDPLFRGRGIATGLLSAAMGWLFENRGAPSVHLTVRDDKSTARRLYERAGFQLHVSGIPADLMIR